MEFKTLYIPARQCGKSLKVASYFLDAMRYAYNDTLLANSNLKIVKVIFNKPATIIIWNDNSKTIVKCAKDELFDAEKGLAMAICKKILGGQFRKTFKKWTPEEKTEEVIKEGSVLISSDEEIKNLIKYVL